MLPLGTPAGHVGDSSQARRSLIEASRPDLLRRVHITMGALQVGGSVWGSTVLEVLPPSRPQLTAFALVLCRARTWWPRTAVARVTPMSRSSSLTVRRGMMDARQWVEMACCSPFTHFFSFALSHFRRQRRQVQAHQEDAQPRMVRTVLVSVYFFFCFFELRLSRAPRPTLLDAPPGTSPTFTSTRDAFATALSASRPKLPSGTTTAFSAPWPTLWAASASTCATYVREEQGAVFNFQQSRP